MMTFRRLCRMGKAKRAHLSVTSTTPKDGHGKPLPILQDYGKGFSRPTLNRMCLFRSISGLRDLCDTVAQIDMVSFFLNSMTITTKKNVGWAKAKAVPINNIQMVWNRIDTTK